MIVFVHLLNDRTGSPRVLKTVIENFSGESSSVLYVGSQGRGVLDGVEVRKCRYWYRRTGKPATTLITYALSQIILFFKLLADRSISRDAIIYVNTLLPFGAAVFGHITGRTVLYHIHEISLSPAAFQKALVFIARTTATRFIYVSKSHLDMLPIDQSRSTVVPNAIDLAIEASAIEGPNERHGGVFTVLMLASARAYKGLHEFADLARSLEHRSDIGFALVLSDKPSDMDVRDDFGPNVSLLPPTDSPQNLYKSADLVVNLSRVDLWVETFGLTLLEAMAFGIPVIGPPVGGPAELIVDGVSGFQIDSRDTSSLRAVVEALVDDRELHARVSAAARRRAMEYDGAAFALSIHAVIQDLRTRARAKS